MVSLVSRKFLAMRNITLYSVKFPDFFYSAMPAMHIRQTSDDGLPIPPYMPMQQPMSKRSTSLEKRIKKKKEKEGCKQQ